MSRPSNMDTTATSVEEVQRAPPALSFPPPDADLNGWRMYRDLIRQPAAEFVGTMLLVLFGTGVNCQVSLSANTGVASSPKGDYLSVSFGWAVGLSIGFWISDGISGGHINPAVTLSLATWRGFPWRKVPGYILAQLLGAIVGAGIIYGNYVHAIDIVEGGRNIRTLATAGNFGTFSLDYMTNVSCFFTEFLGTAILVLVILAVKDNLNPNGSSPPSGLLPLAIFILFLGIAASLGMQTGFALNPARDLGPRILTSLVGYGTDVYTFRNHYWIWCPIMASILGAQIATMLYDTILRKEEQSVMKKPDQRMEIEKIV